ncbi:MAG: hypothetical protein ABI222_08805 [Opitutaceae bacterium]
MNSNKTTKTLEPPLSADLDAVFAESQALIRKVYGDSPSPEILMRLWLSSATPIGVLEEFEDLAVHDGEPLPRREEPTHERALNL